MVGLLQSGRKSTDANKEKSKLSTTFIKEAINKRQGSNKESDAWKRKSAAFGDPRVIVVILIHLHTYSHAKQKELHTDQRDWNSTFLMQCLCLHIKVLNYSVIQKNQGLIPNI